MARFCASCGTEVDETAIFCPTCGQPIDQDVETSIPPAPAWPEPTDAVRRDPSPEPTRPLDPSLDASLHPAAGERAAWPDAEPVAAPPAAAPEPDWRASAGDMPHQPEPARDEPAPPPPRHEADPIRPVSERRYDAEPTDTSSRVVEAHDPGTWEERERPVGMAAATAASASAPESAPTPGSAPNPGSAATPASAPTASPSPLSSVPVTAPVTLSGWLIGGGATIAAIGALISVFDGNRAIVDLLVLLAMSAVAISTFFSSRLPALAHVRLATLAIVLVAFGATTDRILAGVGGVGELLLFLGAAAAVIGALILELGRDQPLGGGS